MVHRHYFRPTRKIWRCAGCQEDFSVTSGTIFAFHKLPLRLYLAAGSEQPGSDHRCRLLSVPLFSSMMLILLRNNFRQQPLHSMRAFATVGNQ
jgi:hypothetical protein